MGFKRTSEGRVFFQGAEESDGPARKPADFRTISRNNTPSPTGTPPQPAAQATQFQILTLLKALNEKLKDSQSERNRMRTELDEYRKLVEDLEEKAERHDRAYQEIEQKVSKGVAGKAERAEKLAEDTMKELQETRKLLLEIEDKTEKADKGMLTLQRQIGQTRAESEELAKKQASYDELARRLDENDTKHEDLSEKLEQTASEQARLSRQIEKVAEDRARFMRKIERIEETVIQTRDALSAKAMVLLTEQGTPGRGRTVLSAASSAETFDTIQDEAREERAPAAWLHSKFLLRAAAAVAVLAVGVLSGWAVNKIWQSGLPALEDFSVSNLRDSEETQDRETAPRDSIAAAEFAPENAVETPDVEVQTDTGQFAGEGAVDVTEPSAPENTADLAAPPQPGALSGNPAENDLGTLDLQDQKKLEQMLEDAPDTLAAQLNNIEPSDAVPVKDLPTSGGEKKAESVQEKSGSSAEKPTEKPVEKSAVKEKPSVKATPAPVPAADQRNALEDVEVVEVPPPAAPANDNPKKPEPKDLIRRMKPDSSLPAEARQIENQAYAGVPEAQHDLAAIYTVGQGGVKQDYARAQFWFRQAAEQGIANARYNLGVLYHQGLGVKPDIKQAIQWYQSAADLGHPEAQYNLGIAYIEGIGVDYDPVTAAKNFESAAKHNIVEAAYNLGLIYENGLLGKADPAQALHWYKSAADQGSPEAKEALQQLAKTLNIKLEDINRVAEAAGKTEKSAEEKAPVTKPAKQPAATKAAPEMPPPARDMEVGMVSKDQALTAQVQEYLMQKGLYPGPADGVGGIVLQDAIRSYQLANELDADGQVTETLLRHMLANEKDSAND